jgi:predicted RNase H-like HicB family nuclease
MDTNLRYRVLISWSDEDDAFIAEVPELPGCAADGRTYQEAVAKVEIVMREWIETARSLKRQIPVPDGK